MNQHTDKKGLEGLIAATYTPLNRDHGINTKAIDPMVEHLLQNEISGLYTCGSTGEGMSLSSEERKEIAEAYVLAAAKRVPVIVQIGHNSIIEARQLAEHAQTIGADMISATCPSYFKVDSVSSLVDCMAEIASCAPKLPFYYYHIPALTGSKVEGLEFLKRASDRIPNLAGVKYTDTKLHEFQECLELENGRFDVLWGCDEMLLGALAIGAHGAIGSTYNISPLPYHQIITAFFEGNLHEARRLQSLMVKMIRTLSQYPFHSAMKAVLAMQGFDMGSCRLPQGKLSEKQITTLRSELKAMGFFEWSQSGKLEFSQ